jgi:HEAT repeat protein
MFMGATSGTALLVSLLGANRLAARVGVAALILVMPMIYLGGFAVLVSSTAFLPLLGFRFVQMVWMGGVWAGAWQSLYNVLPPEHRDGTRAFVEGVALQVGVVIAGVVLILADRVLEPGVASVTWLVIAGAATATAMQLRRAYAKAVVEALRVGNPDVFLVEEEPFGGFRRDATAMSVVTRAATDPDPAVRRVAVEILTEIPHSNGEVFLRALSDKDPTVRAAGLRGIRRLGPHIVTDGPGAKLVTGLLGDEDAAVRLAAVEALSEMNGSVAAAFSPLLRDPDPRVRARASGRLLGRDPGAVETLRAMGRSEDAEWRAEAIREWGRVDNGLAAARSALSDPDPLVRSASVSALAGHDADVAVSALVTALGDRDASIRSQAVEGLVRAGPASVRPLLDARPSPELEAGAMKALVLLEAVEHSVVAGYLDRKVSLASRYAAFLGVLRDADDPRVALVAHALRHAARFHAVEALEVASRSWDDQAAEAIALAIENLEVRDPAQRAIALETLEAVGQTKVIRPLLAAWEERISVSGDRMTVLAELMQDPEPWVRACAAFAGAQHAQLRPYVQRLAHADPDTIVREAAAAAHGGEANTETLSNLSLMERIVFLRRVQLFVNLTPTDIKHVAEVATEHAFAHGVVISEQGDLGEEMHVVLSGDIRVVVDRGREPSIEVARRVTGEYVGEMAVVSRAPRMASLVAEGEVRTLAIDRRRFERILRERPAASLAVMSVLCDRLRELHQDAPEALS